MVGPGEAVAADTTEDLAALAACWQSLGLRAAAVEWELERPALLTGSLAMRLRSALGPALGAAGASSQTLRSIPGDSRPAALWFLGWECPPRAVLRLGAELRCLGAVAPDWPALELALRRLRLPAADGAGGLAGAAACRIRWLGASEDASPGFGPPLVEAPRLDLAGGACRVEAVTPLQLRMQGRAVSGPPPFQVLVRSAGERLRLLCQHWGAGAEALPPVISRAYWEACRARLVWAGAARAPEVVRRSSSTGQAQRISGVVGVFGYEEVTPLAMAVLAIGGELGVGKDTAFGCGQVRIYGAEKR